VAVADGGMGIPRSLSGLHAEAADPEAALEIALRAHVSGTFGAGESGSGENAGLGLFFIAEMAKLTAGRLLIASRGATLRLQGAEDPELSGPVEQLATWGFPGTLVAFELPLGEVQDFARLLQTIQERARIRTPARAIHRWLRFEAPPPGTQQILMSMKAENTAAARALAQETLEPAVLQRRPVALDFRNMRICTQSFLHALLYEVLRLAWARRSEIYVVHASPAVKSALRHLESYALGG
jgi:hypothetical protein